MDRSITSCWWITRGAPKTKTRKSQDTTSFVFFYNVARRHIHTYNHRAGSVMDCYGLSLPVEVMCIVLDHLPDPWWVAAARTCRWWRSCARTACLLLRRGMVCGPWSELKYTLNASVLGGYIGAALWAAGIIGADLPTVHSVTGWMASALPRSWQDAVTKAILIERDDIVSWIAQYGFLAQRRLAAEIAAAHGRIECVEKLPPNVKTTIWSHRVLPCALAYGDIRCVDMLLANEHVPVKPQAPTSLPSLCRSTSTPSFCACARPAGVVATSMTRPAGSRRKTIPLTGCPLRVWSAHNGYGTKQMSLITRPGRGRPCGASTRVTCLREARSPTVSISTAGRCQPTSTYATCSVRSTWTKPRIRQFGASFDITCDCQLYRTGFMGVWAYV